MRGTPAYGLLVPGAVVAVALGATGVSLPVSGELDPEEESLLVSTLLIGLVDGFNPCSLWVLTVLLGVTVRAGREKVLAVGLTFLSVTALIYGLFIAGVLSVFSYVSHLDEIRLAVAGFALAFGVVSVKDFLAPDWGFSFSIPESHRPGLYDRIRTVLRTDGLLSTVGATALLAAGVALLELPCTSGLPLAWSNLVAASDPSTPVYVGLLATYVLTYLSVELVIFGVAVVTLDRIRYDKRRGRALKLLAGTVMLGLGGALLVDPTVIENVRAMVGLFAGAVGTTALVSWLFHRTGRL